VVTFVETYKWLSPDSGDQTVNLLNATVNLIAQAISNSSNEVLVERIVASGSQPFHRKFSDVMANILCFSSLVVCIGCAIAATLIQQWTRRYLAHMRGRGTPDKRARVREYLSNGLRKFQASGACHLLNVLLHLSIFFYSLSGIFVIVHIDSKLLPGFASYLSFCLFLYAITTVLPFFSLDCPYSTPLTPLMCRLYHFFMFGICLIILGIAYVPLALLAPRLLENLEFLKKQTVGHKARFLNGLKWSDTLYTIDLPV
jgi:hypothetical protein